MFTVRNDARELSVQAGTPVRSKNSARRLFDTSAPPSFDAAKGLLCRLRIVAAHAVGEFAGALAGYVDVLGVTR
jgi:hypothetical protein